VTTRLAFVSDAVYPFNKGGKEKRLHEITRRLARGGYEIDVYTMRWWDGPDCFTSEGVRFHAISRFRPLYNGDRRSMRQAILFGVATLRLLTRRFDALDVDHMPFFPLFSARLVCSLRRRPLFATWHEVWGKDYWRNYLGPSGVVGHLVERLSFRMPDVILSNSEHTTERLVQIDPRLRVATVPLGVDFDHIASVPPAPGGADVLFAGRLLPNKNVDVLLRAVHLARASGRELCCRIVGEGPERPRLERLAAELGLAGAVEFSDFLEEHDDLLMLMKSCGVFVLPSAREGFGIVALEANACGVPVVTVDHPDNAARHLITDGRNGYVTRLDPASLSAGIVRALDDRAHLRPAEFVSEHFAEHDWSEIATRVGGVLTGRPPRTSRPTVAVATEPA
jgi:glycosyltransferase involved in cell wall biosynthesis